MCWSHSLLVCFCLLECWTWELAGVYQSCQEPAARTQMHTRSLYTCTHRHTNACVHTNTLIYRAQLHAHSVYTQLHAGQTHTCDGTSGDAHPSARSTWQGHPKYHPAASSSTRPGSARAELMVPKGLGKQLLPPCYCVVGTRRPSGCYPQHLLARLPNPRSCPGSTHELLCPALSQGIASPSPGTAPAASCTVLALSPRAHVQAYRKVQLGGGA